MLFSALPVCARVQCGNINISTLNPCSKWASDIICINCILSRFASSSMLCKTTPAANYLFQGKPHSESQGAEILPSPWLLWTVHVLYLVYEKNRCWPLPVGGLMCRVLTWILIQVSQPLYEMAIITPIFRQAPEIQRRKWQAHGRAGTETPATWWRPQPSGLHSLLSLASPLWSQRESHARSLCWTSSFLYKVWIENRSSIWNGQWCQDFPV